MKRLPLIILFALITLISTSCSQKENEMIDAPSPTPEFKQSISYFETTLLDKEEGRINNVSLACDAINGTILAPDAEFSFNEIVGQRTEEKGYQEATIIIDDEKERGIGGGICQVSSTLYNAALDAGFEITERHEHSKNIGYIELGRDATITGNLDLKFINTLSTNVKIEAKCMEGIVFVNLWK